MSASGASVLVVEDDPTSLLLIQQILSLRGYHVEACADAEKALAEAQLQPFEIAILDIQLPGMDGVELCRRLRKLPSGEDMVVIFLTGAEKPEDLQRALDAGADDYVVKPVNGPNLPVRLALAERVLYFRQHSKRSQERLAEDALRDTVTDLVSRSLFMERLENAARRTARENEKGVKDGAYQYAVLYLNLDGFNRVNTQHGYDSGNRILREAAGRLVECIREVDTVSRFGGDEFVILLDDLKDDTDPTRVSQRIQSAFARPFDLGQERLRLTVSIGIALNTIGPENPKGVLADARKALFRAKTKGPGSSEMYDTTVHDRTVARLQLEAKLKDAVEAGEMTLHYQPIVDLQSAEIRGFEALMRWEDPERGLVPPARFMPVAERTGLIVPMGWWALTEAARQVGAWRSLPEVPDSLFVCVNLSARQFAGPDIVDNVLDSIDAAGLPMDAVHVEITETALMSDLEGARRVLSRLRDAGVKVHVDDFGTGYSSLSYLVRLPVDSLKIDRSFVSEIAGSRENLEVVRAIAQLAENLRLSVIVEGVETRDQLEALREMSCEYGQGYLFGKPQPPADLEEPLRSRRALA